MPFGPKLSLRYDRSGTLELSIHHHGDFGGVDADAHGNIWITQYDGLRSYDPNGHPLGYWPNPRLWEGNMAIDESRGLLYQGYQPGGIELFDIHQAVPISVGMFPTAEVFHLHLAPGGDSLQVATTVLAPLFWEYGVDGTQRPPFIVPSVRPDATIFDAIAIQVPEPSLGIAALSVLVAASRVRL